MGVGRAPPPPPSILFPINVSTVVSPSDGKFQRKAPAAPTEDPLWFRLLHPERNSTSSPRPNISATPTLAPPSDCHVGNCSRCNPNTTEWFQSEQHCFRRTTLRGGHKKREEELSGRGNRSRWQKTDLCRIPFYLTAPIFRVHGPRRHHKP